VSKFQPAKYRMIVSYWNTCHYIRRFYIIKWYISNSTTQNNKAL